MSNLTIQLSGVGVELALGKYMPKDTTIFTDWQEFYHYHDLIHESQLMVDHISEMTVILKGKVIYKGKVPASQIHAQKSFSPVMAQQALYLRTECAENAVYSCELDVEQFDITKLTFQTQDYDLLFKVGKLFLSKLLYEEHILELEWVSATAIGNICLLCRFDNGCLLPVYDAVNKLAYSK